MAQKVLRLASLSRRRLFLPDNVSLTPSRRLEKYGGNCFVGISSYCSISVLSLANQFERERKTTTTTTTTTTTIAISSLDSQSRIFSSEKDEETKSNVESDETFEQLSRSYFSSTVAKRLQQMKTRHGEILNALHSGSSTNASELSSLANAVSLYERMEALWSERSSMQELLDDAKDEEEDDDVAQECELELQRLEKELNETSAAIVDEILPRNSDDFVGTDAVLEIRAGTGGDEAALFSGELLEAYRKAAKAKGWKFEILSETLTDLGGIKDAAVAIVGSSYGGHNDSEGHSFGPYGYFKYESGVHRVQRVPVNDVRIHTSATSVAVLPTPSTDGSSESSLDLNPADLRIDTYRASGAGGQHVNTTDSAVRITHLPTGTVVAIQDERSQHKNKAKALRLIAARVRDQQREEEMRQRGEARNSLMGGGDRSERIRTYNYPQDRVTDHRCKHSEHGIARLLSSSGGSGNDGGEGEEGLVSVFAPYLRVMERDELLLLLEKEEEGPAKKEASKGR